MVGGRGRPVVPAGPGAGGRKPAKAGAPGGLADGVEAPPVGRAGPPPGADGLGMAVDEPAWGRPTSMISGGATGRGAVWDDIPGRG